MENNTSKKLSLSSKNTLSKSAQKVYIENNELRNKYQEILKEVNELKQLELFDITLSISNLEANIDSLNSKLDLLINNTTVENSKD